MVYNLIGPMKLRSETMALDIKEIKLNKRQEKQIMDAAREKGRIYLILDGEKVKLSAKDAGDDVTVIDFGNDYYEELLTTLGDKGIVPSKELNKAIEKVLSDEKVYEDGEFFKAIAEIEDVTVDASARLRKQIEQLLADPRHHAQDAERLPRNHPKAGQQRLQARLRREVDRPAPRQGKAGGLR